MTLWKSNGAILKSSSQWQLKESWKSNNSGYELFIFEILFDRRQSAYLEWWEPSYPSAVTDGVICIKSMHSRTYTTMHSVRIFSEQILRELFWKNSLKKKKTFVKAILIMLLKVVLMANSLIQTRFDVDTESAELWQVYERFCGRIRVSSRLCNEIYS